jgi:hypothetical protein
MYVFHDLLVFIELTAIAYVFVEAVRLIILVSLSQMFVRN